MKLIHGNTCVDAWLQGCNHLLTCEADDYRDYNVILEISHPYVMTAPEHEVLRRLDKFFMAHKAKPVNTVVNTLFPAKLYQQFGPNGVYEKYMNEVYPEIIKHPDCQWGTYAQRLISRTDKAGETVYPLKYLVDKLKKVAQKNGGNRAEYELGIIDPFLDLPIYYPETDKHYPLGGPCLSHLSFKVGPPTDRRLHLTAMYRSHHYVQRALGNFLGLAHLLNFVSQETGLEMGSLTCVSTIAHLEHGTKMWKKPEIRPLIAELQSVSEKAAA